ncbi:MAG TPA: hypothetical protein VD902_14295 [Symbiobacteriaceae bacterium]|nr:hypothetical protein [Symbiobacteriaceae bacterium]
MTFRIAVTGKPWDATGTDLSGEILAETIGSMHLVVDRVRNLLDRYQGVALEPDHAESVDAVTFCFRVLAILNTYLHRCHDFRYWWNDWSDKALPPGERQAAYPGFAQLQTDLLKVRAALREIQNELARTYGFERVLRRVRMIGPLLFSETSAGLKLTHL